MQARVSDVTPNPPRESENEKNSDDEIEAMKERFQCLVLVPLLAKFLPDVGQPQTPWKRSGESVDHKALQVHARDARRKSYESAYDRKQAAGENNRLDVFGKPTVCNIKIVM